ncbi:MAG: PRC-barrel domain containing protein [Mongoliibacter sp.]|uniref:PRC-barrel domain-containing protein n=1 Tax=Mongoliibacter sp. TaxID=2022438 RepID=UPI0012F22F36|nr:PRC-barrel domain-containing protein [Mongoliibacter sp.]TVP53173.1 MAG: PRC-barrel domain containing protein [Mongoliibacter sp.]
MENTNGYRVLSGSNLQGTDVRTPADESIGEIKDIMIDVSTGEVLYAVLSVSTGFLNLENKYFAVAWKALDFNKYRAADDNDHVITLDVSKERLEKSPGFDKDNWPSHADSDFANSVNSYYGVEVHRTL